MTNKRIDNDLLAQLSEDIIKHQKTLDKNQGCFVVKSANEWIEEAKNRPIPNMLFGELWYEGELCILFADTNVGKSILAVQIADSISTGLSVKGFQIELQASKVVYFDFELSDKQFEKRYSNDYEDHYNFSSKLIRAEINTELQVPKDFKNFEEFLIFSVKDLMTKHSPKVIIIDNITYLKTDNERAKDALSLMKELKSITREFGVSILVLAHTPKRECTKPITKNDLSGSKMLINFCDSAFAIGESCLGNGLRYIKQIKQRNTEHIYHSENVVLFEIKQDFNFLKFDFIDYDIESNHLVVNSGDDKANRKGQMQELRAQGMTNVDIASKFNVSEGTVRYTLDKKKLKK